MTNGEKMQAVFPDIEMWGESIDTLDYSLGGMIHRVTKSWWNAEYKEPTTKNDLGVDCISRADAIGCLAGQIELSPSNVAAVHEYLKCVNKRLHDLPSVTPQEPILDKIRAEIKVLTNNRGFLSCDVDYIHEEIDAVFDKYKEEYKQTNAESEES